MDDMLIFAADKKQLHNILATLKTLCHPNYTRTEGIALLGFRVFPGLKRLHGQALRRYRKRLRLREQAYQAGDIDVETLTTSVQSMIAHLHHADTHRLRQSLLSSSFAIG